MPREDDRDLVRLPELVTELLAAVEQLELQIFGKHCSAHTHGLAQRASSLLAQINAAVDQLEDGPIGERWLAIASAMEIRLAPLLTRLRDKPLLH